LLHAELSEFSAMDYALNIVSKCHFFFIFKHMRAPKRSWKIVHGGAGKSQKSPGFFWSVKEWEPWFLKFLQPLLSFFGTISVIW